MYFKRNKVLLGKIVLFLAVLLLVGSTILGCARTGGQPKGWSGVVVADGSLFLGSMSGKLVALNASGSRLWEVLLEDGQTTGGGFGCTPASTSVAIYGTPAVDGDLVYAGGYNGKIYAINSSSGALRWVYPRQGSLEPIVGGLVVALGKVYFGGSEGKVYALDAVTGDWQWEFQTGDKIWSTPVIDGDTLYIGSFDKKLYAIDATTGKEKWEKPFETEGAVTSTAVVNNNTVYVGSFDRHLYAIDATNGKQIWRFPVADEADNQPANWFWARPVVFNNTIYAGNLDGKIYILNAETGIEVIAAIELGSPVSSWPVLVDSSVIIASEEGVIYTLDTENNQIRQLANVEEKIYAPLYTSQGVVYIHTQTHETLYALNVETGAMLWNLPLTSK